MPPPGSPRPSTLPSPLLFTLLLFLTLSTLPTPSQARTHPTYKEHLAAANHALKHAAGGNNSSQRLKSEWPPLFSPALFQRELWRAVESLAAGGGSNGSFAGKLSSGTSAVPNVTAACVQHTTLALELLLSGNNYSLAMLDAMGKPSPDIKLFNLVWPGSLKECQGVTFPNETSSQPLFSGEYCTAHITLAKQQPGMPLAFAVSMGICVPDTCSSMDVSILLNEALAALKISLPQYAYADCQNPNPKPVDGLTIAGIVVVGLFLALMIVGTTLDIMYRQMGRWRARKMDRMVTNNGHHARDLNSQHFHNHQDDNILLLGAQPSKISEPGIAGKALIAFSVYTNGAKLLSTEQGAGTLGCVHGIRFLSMTWVVLGHTFLFPLYFSSNAIGYIQEALKRWTFQAIINASVSVDTFFVLSGLLVAYLSLKEMKRNAGKINWFKFYFHRFWRLTPPYMLIILVYVSLGQYWGSGPAWPAVNPDSNNCKTSWWTNLLYINNFVHTDKVCLGQSWYLANDMQFYILSPLIFVAFYYSPIYGVVSTLVFLIATTVPPAAITMTKNLQSSLTNQGSNSYFDDYYIKPYNRMGPYLMGMVTGYLLYRTDCRARMNKVVNLFCWALAAAAALAVLYGIYETYQGHPLTRPLSAFYNAAARPAWGASVAWVVFACVTGNGGFVNTILSWKAFVPLSRLTYVIYLIHIMVLNVYVLSRDTTFYYSDANIVVLFLGLLAVCYMLSAVVSMAFEAPMMALEKLVLNHKKTQ